MRPNLRLARTTWVTDPTPGTSATGRASTDLRTERLTLVSLTPGWRGRPRRPRRVGTHPWGSCSRVVAGGGLRPRAAAHRRLCHGDIHPAHRPYGGPNRDRGDRLPRPTRRYRRRRGRLQHHSGVQGQGFAFEATRALIEDAFATPGVRRVVAECLDDNRASLRVLEKLGMRRVGSAGSTIRFELRRT